MPSFTSRRSFAIIAPACEPVQCACAGRFPAWHPGWVPGGAGLSGQRRSWLPWPFWSLSQQCSSACDRRLGLLVSGRRQTILCGPSTLRSPSIPDRPANRHGGLDEKLATFLNAAAASIDVAIYQLDLPNVTQALLDAEKRGVQVRLVTDIDTLDDRTQNGAFAALQAAGIVVVGGNPKGIMHDKFAVVDGAASGPARGTSQPTMLIANNNAHY